VPPGSVRLQNAGNLGAHIETLSKAGYVAVETAFVDKKP
jgi:hypothetical protein